MKPRTRQCPRCYQRTTAPSCCGIIFAARSPWRMTKTRIQLVHALARGAKGLDEEAYRLRLRAVGVESCKQLSREQFRTFMRDLAKLPDIKRARA